MAIEVSNLRLNIGKRCLLDSISLQIRTGERVAIVGPNGSGKTTLMRCLLGLLSAQSGHIRTQGKLLDEQSRHERARNISYVPQHLPADIQFSVKDFVVMSRYAHGSGFIGEDSLEDETVRLAMLQTGIQHLAEQTVSTLSGGERQKVSIAAALAQQASILILDEPTSDLDPRQRDITQRLIAEISGNGQITILTVTHDLNWAAMNFDRIIGMSKGRILFDAPPATFINRETLRILFDGEWIIHPHPQSGAPMVLPACCPSML